MGYHSMDWSLSFPDGEFGPDKFNDLLAGPPGSPVLLCSRPPSPT